MQKINKKDVFAKLLSERDKNGKIPLHPYSKWRGAHWVLVQLADLDYQPGDKSLIPLREQVLKWILSKRHVSSVRKIAGKYRRCASQEGNALYSTMKLGLDDERCEDLVKNLLKWQWPDGGWNCDTSPKAKISSFHESLIPLRALSLYKKTRNKINVDKAVNQTKEPFLSRKLFRRKTNDNVMNLRFAKLHYPQYWHYDFLFGLKVMAEAGFLNDPRCNEAIELLKSKKLTGGGFPAEGKHYKVRKPSEIKGSSSTVDWGGVDKNRPNPFVTKDALFVLKTTQGEKG